MGGARRRRGRAVGHEEDVKLLARLQPRWDDGQRHRGRVRRSSPMAAAARRPREEGSGTTSKATSPKPLAWGPSSRTLSMVSRTHDADVGANVITCGSTAFIGPVLGSALK